MEIQFTDEEKEQIELKVIELCKLYPNAVYKSEYNAEKPRCLYSQYPVENGPETPGCVVGQAIRLVCPDKFKIIEDWEQNGFIKDGKKDYCIGSAAYLLNLDTHKANLVNIIQSQQDAGNSWGESLKLATLLTQ